jgi:hypothetical protein
MTSAPCTDANERRPESTYSISCLLSPSPTFDRRAEDAERRELEGLLERERAFAVMVFDERRVFLAHPAAHRVAGHDLLFREEGVEVEEIAVERGGHGDSDRR